jgi:hypothetical protein
MPDTEHVVLRLCGKRSEPNPEKSYHGI